MFIIESTMVGASVEIAAVFALNTSKENNSALFYDINYVKECHTVYLVIPRMSV